MDTAYVKRDQHNYLVGPDIPPVVEIDPGQEVMVETMDAFAGIIVDETQLFHTAIDYISLISRSLPVTGPIAVKGAEPGDIIAVHVPNIRVEMDEGRAITMAVQFFGGLSNPHSLTAELGPDTKVC